jgi:phosphoribosylformylglycinamidine (FGAM) synthase-like amidotransferase family enzyme
MKKLSALVVSGNGTNCERETAFACEQAGFERADIVPIWDITAGEVRLGNYQLLCLPGGFLDGDDLGAARAATVRWKYARLPEGTRLWEELLAFIDRGGLVLGICNGFQLLVKLGLIPALDGAFEQQATLAGNDSARFEDRWVTLGINSKSPCVFTRGLERLELPVRHGEGKFIAPQETLQRIESQNLAPIYYLHPQTGKPALEYPHNPNGSLRAIAGLCDESGRLFGLMPHPECYLHRTHHPRWTREELPEEGAGLLFFKNAAGYLRQ